MRPPEYSWPERLPCDPKWRLAAPYRSAFSPGISRDRPALGAPHDNKSADTPIVRPQKQKRPRTKKLCSKVVWFESPHHLFFRFSSPCKRGKPSRHWPPGGRPTTHGWWGRLRPRKKRWWGHGWMPIRREGSSGTNDSSFARTSRLL